MIDPRWYDPVFWVFKMSVAGDSLLCFKAFHIHFKQTTDFSLMPFNVQVNKFIYTLRVKQSESLSFLRFVTITMYF